MSLIVVSQHKETEKEKKKKCEINLEKLSFDLFFSLNFSQSNFSQEFLFFYFDDCALREGFKIIVLLRDEMVLDEGSHCVNPHRTLWSGLLIRRK
ncbi:CLUMA_CG018364, isoform A [Clunio marinus]|uniref:CLUMA_CG018364, isoform A n=1 Tax=Clunio marinus TaxID=568069 RepID=A0A1J1IYC7_9DIPT|nr:CLUMA_CG018364, isoform A [Clunio marinus]